MNKLKEIARVLSVTSDAESIEGFLKSILTRNEIDEISGRWELVKLLHEGMSQRRIAERLGLSLCKITRGSKELKKSRSPFKTMIETHRSINEKKPV
ncbi:MAG: transcriptional regulator [Spirochaetes bacterium]|nr:transcriptional regulator [Spirochaetota bacterium]